MEEQDSGSGSEAMKGNTDNIKEKKKLLKSKMDKGYIQRKKWTYVANKQK